ncbi:hypothetical protein AB9P05_15990 [Roseivirga sp. BDSF3-8]|uniref:hypothetical protein n=1 Tax=Roseivirga sp. BDSF3-8 TaxID=3241598 RepID=UPI003531ED22
MNRILTRGFIAMLAMYSGLLLMGCFYIEDDDTPPFIDVGEPYHNYDPIYMDRDEFEGAVGSEAPRQLSALGKIWRYNNLLLVGERYQGIHVIDNTNPASPVIIAFISIPGNVDMALKGNRLFVDSGPDLLSLDISDVNNIRVVERVPNVYIEVGMTDPDGFYYSFTNQDNQVLVGFKRIDE